MPINDDQTVDFHRDAVASVQNGRIVVKGPSGGGMARIGPCDLEGLEVIVNGRKARGFIEVDQNSSILVRTDYIEPSVSFQITLENGGALAKLHLKAKDGTRYVLKDAPFSRTLKLEVEKVTIPAKVDYSEVLNAVKEKGIVFGLDEQACREACLGKAEEPVIIARGKPCVPGKDGRIDFLVPLEKVIELPLDELRVDFRESVKIPDVKPGQAIAVKRPAVPGTSGISVTGKPLYPPKVKDPPLRAGKGVRVEEREGFLFAIATLPGLPRFTESSGMIEVDPVFHQKGDVDISSGNIRFSGSVEINGNVTEGAVVKCEGNQEIFGTVTGATLEAWGSVKVRGNVFQSKIFAGKDAGWVRKWDSLLRKVEENLFAISEIQEHEANIERVNTGAEVEDAPGHEGTVRSTSAADILKGLDEAEASLLADKFRMMVIALSEILKEDLSKLPREISDKFMQTRDVLFDKELNLFDKADRVARTIYDVRIWIEEENKKSLSDVVLQYVQSSQIESVRDIIVSGQGVFYSTLRAGRSVKVEGVPGIVRGSEVTATELISVKAAGGYGPTPTVLRVSERGRIVVGTLYPNTILVLGKHKVRSEKTLESVEAKLIEGDVVVSSSTGIAHVD